MNIAYLDLNEDDLVEDYSSNPNRYGGGRIVCAALLKRLDNCFLFANSKCFDNIETNKRNQCISLDLEARKAIKNGAPIKNYIQDLNKYDIFLHHNAGIYINLEGHNKPKQAVWPVGWREKVHEKTKNILMFDQEGQETLYSSDAKIYDIVIGPDFEPFEIRRKEDFIFQCSRHNHVYQSIQLAVLSNKYNIKTYFSGPIEKDYPLLNYINNINTFYVGSISQDLKKDFFKKAKANVQIQTYPISATLTGKEASSYGVAIIAAPIGGWNNYVKHGVNGFFIKNEEDFINAWRNIDYIKQEKCYEIGLKHSEENMFKKVMEALKDIYNN